MLRLFVVVTVLAACGDKPPVRRPGQEVLTEIRIEGSKALDEDDVIAGLSLDRARQRGGTIDPYQLSLDTERIRAAYLRRGYFRANVSSRIDSKKRAGVLEQVAVFTVREGPRATVRVDMRGLPPEVPLATARALVGLPDGAPFDYSKYDAAKQPLLALLEDAGYPHAQIDAAVIADRGRAIALARFEITPGVRARFGEITVAGASGDLERALRGRLTIAPGQPFSRRAMVASQQAIYGLQRFNSVRFDPDLERGEIVPVAITATTSMPKELRLGAGVGGDPATYETRGRASLSLVLSRFPLWTGLVEGRIGVAYLKQEGIDLRDVSFDDLLFKARAIATLTRHELFRPYVEGQIEGRFDILELEAFDVTGPRARVGLSSPLGRPWLKGRVGPLLEYLWFTDARIDEAGRALIDLRDSHLRTALELTIDAEGRDDPTDPRCCAYGAVRAVVGTLLDRDRGAYGQLLPELRGYLPLPRGAVLAGRARAALVFGAAPVTERLFSGGANSHRGFPERRLSPTALSTDPDMPTPIVIGGTGLFETGAELRIPVAAVSIVEFGVHLFLDGGDVVGRWPALDPTSLHWAAGFGFDIKVAGLKFRIGRGTRLNRTGAGEPQPGQNSSWHFAVGDSF